MRGLGRGVVIGRVRGRAGRRGGFIERAEGYGGVVGGADRLREELLTAWQEGEGDGRRLRFRITEPIELTFQAAVTQERKANAGVKWWLLSLGGEASRGSEVTQTLSLKLAPVMYDPETGQGHRRRGDRRRPLAQGAD